MHLEHVEFALVVGTDNFDGFWHGRIYGPGRNQFRASARATATIAVRVKWHRPNTPNYGRDTRREPLRKSRHGLGRGRTRHVVQHHDGFRFWTTGESRHQPRRKLRWRRVRH